MWLVIFVKTLSHMGQNPSLNQILNKGIQYFRVETIGKPQGWELRNRYIWGLKG